MAAQAIELARRQRESIRDRLLTAAKAQDLSAQAVADFAWLHMTDDDGRPITPAAHHWLWIRLMTNADIRKLLIIAPPESAKTTWFLAYYATSIAFYPEWPHIIAAVSGPVAVKRSITLRNIIKGEAFARTFPDLQPAAGMTWNQDEWSIAPNGRPRPGRVHPTLAAMGVGGSIIGSRARLAGGDDLHDEENSRTAHQRELVHTWLHRSFLSRRMSRVGRSIVIGTAWHHDDTYARMRAEGGWVVCHVPLLSSSNEVYASIHYPEGYKGERLGEPVSRAELEEIHDEID